MEIVELNNMNRNILTSIETLKVENKMYVEDIKKIYNELDELKNCKLQLKEIQKETTVQNASSQVIKEAFDVSAKEGSTDGVQKHKLLLLADSYGRGLSHLWDFFKDYTVQTICKPSAGFEYVARDIKNLTRDFTSEDIVFIIAGSENDYFSFSYEFVNRSIEKCFKTNIIISAIP